MQSIASLMSINRDNDIGNLDDFDESAEHGDMSEGADTKDANTSAQISEIASKFGMWAAGEGLGNGERDMSSSVINEEEEMIEEDVDEVKEVEKVQTTLEEEKMEIEESQEEGKFM